MPVRTLPSFLAVWESYGRCCYQAIQLRGLHTPQTTGRMRSMPCGKVDTHHYSKRQITLAHRPAPSPRRSRSSTNPHHGIEASPTSSRFTVVRRRLTGSKSVVQDASFCPDGYQVRRRRQPSPKPHARRLTAHCWALSFLGWIILFNITGGTAWACSKSVKGCVSLRKLLTRVASSSFGAVIDDAFTSGVKNVRIIRNRFR